MKYGRQTMVSMPYTYGDNAIASALPNAFKPSVSEWEQIRYGLRMQRLFGRCRNFQAKNKTRRDSKRNNLKFQSGRHFIEELAANSIGRQQNKLRIYKKKNTMRKNAVSQRLYLQIHATPFLSNQFVPGSCCVSGSYLTSNSIKE
jgi:hypothetical protein